ncbi:MAG TPA: O-antigen ligase family protein [Gaiellaceae bacterium]|jgi:hypothetical protein|nr:O-antigen ligase family protein [Gaiellaceae bacterium]
MTADVVRLGGLVGALGLSALLLGPTRLWRGAGLAAWAVGCVLLALELAPSGHQRAFAAAGVAGALAALLVGWLFVRVPWTLAVAVVACAPARIPVTVGATKANLLVPLYLVVAGTAVALAVELLAPERFAKWRAGKIFEPRGRHVGEPPPLEVPPERERPVLGAFAWPAALLIGWSGICLLWSPVAGKALHDGAVYLLFYMLPLGLMAAALARLPWRIGWVKVLYVELTAMALVFAAIGVEQYVTRAIYWNPKVIVDNAYAPVGWYFRVNSVFYDPSIYGRFLVVAILASLVLILFERSGSAWIAAALATATLIGLLPSFSQSSFVALAAGIGVALIVLWRRRAILPLALAAAVLVGLTFGVPQLRHRVIGKAGIHHATDGRAPLVTAGVKIAVHHPLVGVGTGGFAAAYAKETRKAGRASHAAPITVAAETGIPGLAFLIWLVGCTFVIPFRGNRGRTATGRARLAFGLALVAIFVHSLFYNALIEDPLFWGALALSAVAYRQAEKS